jgi:uncharacterized protein (TIGR02145 family)
MTNVVLILTFIVTVGGYSNAQSFEWVNGIGENETLSQVESGNGIAVDSSGNVYTTGTFFGNVDFDNGSDSYFLNTGGSNIRGAFVLKNDSNGNFIWAKMMPNADGWYLSIDGQGNIYTSGFFYNTVDFDPGASTYNISGGGIATLYIQKLTINGDFVWAKSVKVDGLTPHNMAYTCDALGNSYLTGAYYGTKDFDPGVGVFNMSSSGTSSDGNVFVLKLDNTGLFVWAKSFYSNSACTGTGIDVDNQGNVLISGSFSNVTDFNPGSSSFSLGSPINTAVFLTKLNANGQFVWAKTICDANSGSYEAGFSVEINMNDEIYVLGKSYGTVDFDPSASVFNLTLSGSGGTFISKLDQNGIFIWAKSLKNTFSEGIPDDIKNKIITDPFDNVYVASNYTNTVDFDPGPGVFNLTPVAYNDAFLLKLTTTGDFVFAKSWGSATNGEYAKDIAIDASGNIYVTGSYTGITDFDVDAGVYNLTANARDIYVLKLGNCGQSLTWQGIVDSDWHKPCNWSPEYVPQCCSDVIIPFTGNQPIISSVAGANSLTIQSTDGALLTVNNGANLQIADCPTTITTSACPSSAVLTTTAVSSITQTTAVSGGTISYQGASTITARGICWSTSPNPTLANSFTTNGTGVGTFTSNLTGLSAGTTYYVRAYATNAGGTSYGNEVSFVTQTLAAQYSVGSVFCDLGPTLIVDVTNPTTGKTWMDRNLGASQVATSSTDVASYGDLYQWGRRADGHQCRSYSTTTSILSSVDQPSHGIFITSSAPNDWRNPKNDDLWQGVNGINNPCPSSYRLPTNVELETERLTWNNNNADGAFSSPLKFPKAGYRQNSNGSVNAVGTYGYYWSSTVTTEWAFFLSFYSGGASTYDSNRGSGRSVRCIKN